MLNCSVMPIKTQISVSIDTTDSNRLNLKVAYTSGRHSCGCHFVVAAQIFGTVGLKKIARGST
jgi:hypothetical protein